MNIGYACICIGQNGLDFKTCRLRNADESNLNNLISNNLDVLDKITDYNITNKVKLFRISSEIIPFGSHPVNTLDWKNIYRDKLRIIGEKIKADGIRVSMHAGAFTVLNSPSEEIVKKSVDDLIYHNDFLTALNTDASSKIIIHIGGAYGNKELALERFIDNYKKLPENIKDRLVVENDEKLYNVEDALRLSSSINIPVVLDVLHNKLNPSCKGENLNYYLNLCRNTWKEKDGRQKIHYSEQSEGKRTGTHSDTVNPYTFLEFCESLKNKDIDIMLEVKDKNLSVMKCVLLTNSINNA